MACQVSKRLVSEFTCEEDVEHIAGVLDEWMATLEGRTPAQASSLLPPAVHAAPGCCLLQHS
jgi:hypothetical protein